MAGMDRRTDNKQDALIDGQLLDALSSETVINAVVSEKYYGISRNQVTGGLVTDHIPGSILMPKTGVLYEKAHCVINKNSVFGSLFMMKQFEVDMRPNDVHRMPLEYMTIQMIFEFPYGDIMVRETGEGYVGYNSDSSENGPYNQYDSSLQPERRRCGIPYCPNYHKFDSFDEGTGATTDSFTKLIGEHYLLHGGLYERLLISTNATTPIYEEQLIPARISCACTDESPPRFVCSFPGTSLNGKHGWFRIDIGFKYLLKPIEKNPYYP